MLMPRGGDTAETTRPGQTREGSKGLSHSNLKLVCSEKMVLQQRYHIYVYNNKSPPTQTHPWRTDACLRCCCCCWWRTKIPSFCQRPFPLVGFFLVFLLAGFLRWTAHTLTKYQHSWNPRIQTRPCPYRPHDKLFVNIPQKSFKTESQDTTVSKKWSFHWSSWLRDA